MDNVAGEESAIYHGPYVPFVRPAVGDIRKQVFNGAGWLTVPPEPEHVFVVWEKHRSGAQGVASVHGSLAGAKASQNGSGAVFEPIEGVPGHWYATLLEGNVEVHIIREELKP